MIAHRRRDLAARSYLSSSNLPHRSNGVPGRPEELEFSLRAEGIRVKYDYFGRSRDQRPSGAPAGRSFRRSGGDGGGDGGEEEFRWLAKCDDDSDIPSPKMWDPAGGSPTAARSPDTSPAHHHQRPTSRALAIARYRQELMGLVRDAPDSAYELSLKDLVELPRKGRAEEKDLVELPRKGRAEEKDLVELPRKGRAEEKDLVELPRKGRAEEDAPLRAADRREERQAAKKGAARRVSRSQGMESGVFLLKMFFPFSLGGLRKISSSRSSSGVCSKVSPKPMLADGEKGGGPERSPEREFWWNKNKFKGTGSGGGGGDSSKSSSTQSGSSSSVGCGSIGSSSSGGSVGGGSIGSSSSCRKMSSCYSFFHARRSKA